MCGRFAQPRSPEELARIFHARPVAELDGPQYNVAPTDPVAAVVERHGDRVVDRFAWGLVPFFADSPRNAARLINARSETVESSPAFRDAYRRHRCIVPADAFYEWRRHRNPETGRVVRSEPFAIRRRDGEPLALAGLWAIWRNPESAERLYSCTILTTTPNATVERVHDRMPVILDADEWDAWLADETPLTELRPMLRPADDDPLEIYPVSPAVNNVRSEGAELLLPITRWAEAP
jgi:putative SOS response-associated peptidase YedK